jgi:hypothetical protein
MTVGFICTALTFSFKKRRMDREKRGSGVLVVFGVCFSLFVAFMFYEVSGCIFVFGIWVGLACL